MQHKFNIGEWVRIETSYPGYPHNHRTGFVAKITSIGDGRIRYMIHIPEKLIDVPLLEHELVKIPEQCYSPATQQIKDDINSFFGLPMTILLNTEQEAYIKEDVRRTKEMMDAVGKMIHEREERKMSMTPKKIMRNGPATIVFWEDGTKTVVKKMPGDKDDIYAAFCAAFTKKYFGSNEKVKATVDSLCGPSEEEIDKIVNDFYIKHADDFCKGYSVVAHIKDEKVSKRFIEKLSEMGFSVKKEQNYRFDNHLLVKRDDAKHIKWCLEHKSFVEKLVITPAYTNGDHYRMTEIANKLAEDGYSVKCLYGNANRDYIYTIEEIEVNKK